MTKLSFFFFIIIINDRDSKQRVRSEKVILIFKYVFYRVSRKTIMTTNWRVEVVERKV